MPAVITIRLYSAHDRTHHAWLSMRVANMSDKTVRFSAEIAEALARDPGNAGMTCGDSAAKVLKADIVGGILMARKQAGTVGLYAELISLGAAIGHRSGVVLEIASVAFAVAANLAVVQGLGLEDLRTAPRGGFGWLLETIEVMAE